MSSGAWFARESRLLYSTLTIRTEDRRTARAWSGPRRACWTLLTAIHAVAVPAALFTLLVRESLDAYFILRFLGLLGATAFCALKAVDVRWLRTPRGWRSKAAAAAIIALLHISVLERATGREIAFTPAHLGVFLCGALFAPSDVFAEIRRVARRVCEVISPALSSARPIHAFAAFAGTPPLAPCPNPPLAMRRSPRAPPAR